jgi:hypothetical protein
MDVTILDDLLQQARIIPYMIARLEIAIILQGQTKFMAV